MGLNLNLLAPEIALAISAIILVLADLLIKRKGSLAIIALLGIVVSGILAFLQPVEGRAFNGMFLADNFALFFKMLFLAAAAFIVLASIDYVSRLQRFQGEYYALLLFATLGLMLMASTGELISIYISLELASLSLYALAGLLKDQKSSEASLKYLLLGAMASAILLYGMALLFGLTGKTQLGEIAEALKRIGLVGLMSHPALMVSLVMMAAGFGFKIASVPFQMWVPDVYEGAPTPITAFLSVASKAAGFAVIIRVFFLVYGWSPEMASDWGILFAVLSALSMTAGNIIAIAQSNIKRMMGYSSIAQAGYLMVGLASVGLAAINDSLGRSSILFFLGSYTASNLAAFIAIIAISNRTNSDEINDYAGMAKRAPLLAVGLALSLISLIGIPPTAGFIAKVYIFNAAVQQGLAWLVVIGVINSVISAYYYLRVVKVMFLSPPSSEEKVSSTPPLSLALALTSLAVLLIGLFPALLLELARAAINIIS